MLENVDSIRQLVGRSINNQRKSQLGQYMTPASVARFMASLFPYSEIKTARLLDAGAGVGSLASAFLDRWKSGGFGFKRVEVCAYEVDNTMRGYLSDALDSYAERLSVETRILPDDFIEHAVLNLFTRGQHNGFTHAIMNPPYKKIRSNSRHRLLLRKAGIETVNLYSAFVALALDLLAPGGYLVAIIPRSFCNGPYYKPFRKFILRRAAIRHMHLFESRNRAFKEDGVLQENIIIALERDGFQDKVTISNSLDGSFGDYIAKSYPFNQVVHQSDAERFIYIPNSIETLGQITNLNYSLADIGAEVSTGPVVDFRLKEFLCDMPEEETVPLLYPCHFTSDGVLWPKLNIKKPNAILKNRETEKWLYPKGFYTVIRRFSSKEENRRIVASLIDPSYFSTSHLGFENHLNVLHKGKQGLPEMLARGLTVFLNSTTVDESFRRFSGHTQVNATDLRQMKYPSRAALIALGRWAKSKGQLSQQQIDKKVVDIS